MPEDEAFRILDAAWALGVRAFDTAEAYGSSAARLRAWSDARGNGDTLEVVTKCSVNFPHDGLQSLEGSAHNALARFDGIGRVVLLTHGRLGPDRWDVILHATAKHHAASGQSVYSQEEVRSACALPGIARLQAPGNVLDQRAILARGNAPVFLDVRSIYLQGVLLEDPRAADARAPGSGAVVAAVQATAAMLGTDVAPLLIASVLKVIRAGDRVVIGVDNVSELETLPAAFELPDDTVREFQRRICGLADDRASMSFLDPRNWTAPLAR